MDPYRSVVHTAAPLPPGTPPSGVHHPPSATAVYSVYGGKKQCSGLNGPDSLRASVPSVLLPAPGYCMFGSSDPVARGSPGLSRASVG